MSIWSKILIGFVILAALGFIHAAARTLTTQEAWRSKVVAHEQAIAEVEQAIPPVVYGNPEQNVPGIAGLEIELHKLLSDRGRVWYNVSPGQVDPQTGEVSVETDVPDPHQIAVNSVLYVFDSEDPSAGGRYLGEFKASAVGDRQVTLQPTLPLSQDESQALANAPGPWTLYEVLPNDSRQVFAGKTQQELEALLPPPPEQQAGEDDEAYAARVASYEAIVQPYLRDNQPAEATDPDDRVVVVVKFVKEDQAAVGLLQQLNIPEAVLATGATYEYDKALADQLIAAGVAQEVERKYRRPTLDFGAKIAEWNRQEPLLYDQITAATKDVEYMEGAVLDAENQVKFVQAEIQTLKNELSLMQNEAQLAATRRAGFEKEVAKVQADVTKMLDENIQLAARLAAQQQRAVEQGSPAVTATEAGFAL